MRELKEGEPAISPSTFADLKTPADYKRLADEVRDVSGGVPIGFKLSAQHIERDIDFALEVAENIDSPTGKARVQVILDRMAE